MKREYKTLSMERLQVEMTGSLLTGFVTTVPMKVKDVVVEEYKNGFGSDPTPSRR